MNLYGMKVFALTTSLQSASMGAREVPMRQGRSAIDLTGRAFGRWTVIARVPSRKSGVPEWWCRCECGNEKPVVGSQLRYERSRSCGCWQKELARASLSKPGEASLGWKGGKSGDKIYHAFRMPEHPHANAQGFVREHIFVAEKALGKSLPLGAVVHHADENRKNNANNNLVICQNHAYHKLLHRRMRALRGCGNPNWAKCKFCKEWDDPKNLWVWQGNHFAAHHNRCHNEYQRHKKQRRMGA